MGSLRRPPLRPGLVATSAAAALALALAGCGGTCDAYQALSATITVRSATTGAPITDAIFIEVAGPSVSDAGVGVELSGADAGLDGTYTVDPGDDTAMGTTYSIRISAPGYAPVVVSNVVVGVMWACPQPGNVTPTAETVKLVPAAERGAGADAGADAAT